MVKRVNEQRLLDGFRDFFETLHQAVARSQKIVQLDELAIYEEEISGRGIVRFYFFHGTAEDQKKFFPGENKAYCTFRNSSSTVGVILDGVQKEFHCEFGYILHREELTQGFRFSDGSEEAAEWLIVQVCSHEIRHEIQLRHGLAPSQLRAAFPQIKLSSKISINWSKIKKGFKALYGDYVCKKHPPDYLARELDAIVTSYLSLAEWHRDDLKQESRILKVVEVIRGGR